MKLISSLIIFVLFVCPAVFGVSTDGSLTTMLWTRQEPVKNNGKDFYNYLYEYTRTNITDIGSENFSGYLYARVKKDIANNGKLDWSIFSGYLDWSGPHESSLRIGRQFISNSTDYLQMDGIRANFNSIKGFSHEIYAGSSVSSWTIKENREGVAGIDFNFPQMKQIQSGLSLFTNFSSKNFNRLIIGGHLDNYNYGFFKPGKFNIYSKIGYDVLSMKLTQGDVAVNLNPIEKLGLYADYYHEKQFVPEESIFSVFALDNSNRASIGLNYEPMESISLECQYERHFSSSFPSNTYEIGLYRSVIHGTDLGMTILSSGESSIKSNRKGINLNIGHDITDKLTAKISAYYNDYKLNEFQNSGKISSIQLDLGYRVVDKASVYLRLEDNIDSKNKSSFRLLTM
ncbi:MAG: hypothetical protein AABY27_07370, partial [Pseudomonadota bacterium]